jgi:uncharacterized protein YchJ
MKKLESQKHKRNAKCPCGSGKKLKNCCLPKVKRAQAGIDAGKSEAQIMNEELFGPKE